MELKAILQLENEEKYEAALTKYRQAYFEKPSDFEIWKHYYFFLWYLNVEDGSLGLQEFVKINNLSLELEQISNDGIKKYSQIAEGLFVLGYTINLFPYLFGEYVEWEQKGKEMMVGAANLEPNNIIYSMVVLGLGVEIQGNLNYKMVCKKAAPIVNDKFSSNGLLNSYFKAVLFRIN
ncbi:hypothetical protein [uncultured Arcticibacterium sp.]|uniref:hypothetical protein n=1 Tax=uncultured Arcticibacterium sp. TaxID=2173042 RepID=UPI0030F9E402